MLFAINAGQLRERERLPRDLDYEMTGCEASDRCDECPLVYCAWDPSPKKRQIALGFAWKDTRIVNRFLAGQGVMDIARTEGVPKARVSRALKRHGCWRPRAVTQETETRIVSGFLAGESMAHIAGNVGYSRSTVKNVLKRRGYLV